MEVWAVRIVWMENRYFHPVAQSYNKKREKDGTHDVHNKMSAQIDDHESRPDDHEQAEVGRKPRKATSLREDSDPLGIYNVKAREARCSGLGAGCCQMCEECAACVRESGVAAIAKHVDSIPFVADPGIKDRHISHCAACRRSRQLFAFSIRSVGWCA